MTISRVRYLDGYETASNVGDATSRMCRFIGDYLGPFNLSLFNSSANNADVKSTGRNEKWHGSKLEHRHSPAPVTPDVISIGNIVQRQKLPTTMSQRAARNVVASRMNKSIKWWSATKSTLSEATASVISCCRPDARNHVIDFVDSTLMSETER